jgi:hypothetical protein
MLVLGEHICARHVRGGYALEGDERGLPSTSCKIGGTLRRCKRDLDFMREGRASTMFHESLHHRYRGFCPDGLVSVFIDTENLQFDLPDPPYMVIGTLDLDRLRPCLGWRTCSYVRHYAASFGEVVIRRDALDRLVHGTFRYTDLPKWLRRGVPMGGDIRQWERGARLWFTRQLLPVEGPQQTAGVLERV